MKYARWNASTRRSCRHDFAAAKVDIARVLEFPLPLSLDYPEIRQWFDEKVVPGLENGSRHIYLIERNGDIAALGIAKREAAERKVCTVRIAPNYEGRGFGLYVFDNLLKWLDTDQPHLTIGEHKFANFQRIFESYGFLQTSARNSLYIEQRRELFFNEQGLKGLDRSEHLSSLQMPWAEPLIPR